MSQDGPKDLSALDALFSRHGVGLSSGGQNLSAARKQQIYAGKAQQDQEPVNPTQETLKALIDYEEAIPDQEVDDFVSKIRNAHLLDDYADDTLDHSAGSPTAGPSFNLWPLDEDTPSPTIMADPLSGDILVTDLPNKQDLKTVQDTEETDKNFVEDEEEGAANGTLTSSGDAESEGAVASSDDEDEEAEDLTEEFEMEKGGGGGGDVTADDRHGDGEQSNSNDDGLKDESNDWELIPRVDDDTNDESKDESMKEKPKNENNEDEDDDEEEEEEEDKENEDSMDQTDSSGEASKGSKDMSSTEVPVIINVDKDSIEEPKEEDGKLSDTTEMDGHSSHGDKEHAIPESQEKKSEDPGFEAFCADLGVSMLDVEAQKSRARLSRLGPMAQRRPITKRFSDGREDEDQSKWMFTDSTAPKPKKPSFDEDDEEEERRANRAPPPQPASVGKRPPGFGGMGPMLLPGLGNAISGLKKTPTSSPNKTFQSTLEESRSQKEPTKSAPSPHGSPRKVLPHVGKTPPKPASRPKPHPKPAPTQEPSQPAWMKELKQRSPKKTADVKSVSDVKEEKKKDEKDLNSDILHPAPSEKKEPETQKTPPWMMNGKARLPPISTPGSSNKEEAAPSIPQWKKDLRDKKKTPVPAPSSVQKSPAKLPEKSPAKPPVKPSTKPALRPHPKPAARPVVAKKPPAKLPEKKKKEEKDATDGISSMSESKPAAFKLPEKKMKVEDATDRVRAMSDSKPGAAKQPGKKTVDDVTDGDSEMSDSKKIKLSVDQNGESPIAEEKMDVGASEATSKEENGESREGKDVGSEVRKDEGKDVNEGMEPAMEELKKEEEVEEKMDIRVEEVVDIKIEKSEDVHVEEKKVAIVSDSESKKEESKPAPKSDEPKVTIVKKGKEDSENGHFKMENIDSSTVDEIIEKKEEVPALNDKPRPAENQKAAERPAKLGYKPVKIVTKANNAKKDADVGKAEEKKITIVRKSDVAKPDAGTTDVKKSDVGKSAEVKKPDAEKSGSRKSDSTNEDEKVGGGKSSVTVMTKNSMNKEVPVSQKEEKENEMEMGMNPEMSNMPKWKREALERKQKRKMSGGYAPLHKPSGTIDTNLNMPQWKKDLMEKRKMMPRMASMDAVDREEKGSKENLKSEKVLKRHTIAADVSVNVPSGHKTSVPTWKQELEKRKIGRLAKHLENKDAGPEIKEKNAETVASASS